MFSEKIHQRAYEQQSLLCVGLDPNVRFIRDELKFESVFAFNKAIIDSCHDLSLCFKPQIAHYSAYGLEADLEKTIAYLQQLEIPVILDAKRGDIGSTAEHYAKEAFERYGADAATVNPYLGFDSISPFLEYKDKGVIVLAKTSNPSADIPQAYDIKSQQEPLYIALSKHIQQLSHGNPNLCFVVGATDTTALAQMRLAFPESWFLIPGIGAQGGNLEQTLKLSGNKSIINVSRAINFPPWNNKEDYFALVRKKALEYHSYFSSI